MHTRGPHNARVPHADGGKLVAETVDDAEEFAEKYRALVVAEIQVAILWAACSSVTLRASRKRTPREKRDGAPLTPERCEQFKLIETQSHRVDKCAFGTASL